MITTNGRSIGTVELTTNQDLSAYQQSSTNRMKTNSALLEECGTRENLMNHLRSERFRILRGAMKLMEEP